VIKKFAFGIGNVSQKPKEESQNLFSFAIKDKTNGGNNVTTKKFGEKFQNDHTQVTTNHEQKQSKNTKQNDGNLLIDFGNDLVQKDPSQSTGQQPQESKSNTFDILSLDFTNQPTNQNLTQDKGQSYDLTNSKNNNSGNNFNQLNSMQGFNNQQQFNNNQFGGNNYQENLYQNQGQINYPQFGADNFKVNNNNNFGNNNKNPKNPLDDLFG